ncbi:hypothetical protein [Flavobacterium caeni]|uniref:hypothetical protein n=1 Tax=Flavobacterium caeni TaxID=490189 RepID=UPI000B814FA4|nr:hypothetical protein [Flavobacterium caeni]
MSKLLGGQFTLLQKSCCEIFATEISQRLSENLALENYFRRENIQKNPVTATLCETLQVARIGFALCFVENQEVILLLFKNLPEFATSVKAIYKGFVWMN